MTDHFELSIMTGSRAISGSVAIRCRNCRHRALGVEQPFVHVHVEDVRAAAHLVERHVEGRGENSPCSIRRRNFAEPVTLVRSPIMMKLLSGRIVSVSRPANCV